MPVGQLYASDRKASREGRLRSGQCLAVKPEQIGNPALKQGLQDVIDSNVGWVNLGDFSPSERAEIAEALHTALVSESNRRLPSTVPTRSQVLDLLRELARLAYTATPR